jgi:nucleotide-binding universal stress UspA family protein
MSFKDILVHVDATPASRTRLQLALTLAHRFGAHLSGLHVIPERFPPEVPGVGVGRIDLGRGVSPTDGWHLVPP